MAALFFFASFPVSTRSLPCARRGYCIRNTNPQEKCGSVFASTAPCVLAVALSPSHQPQVVRLWLSLIICSAIATLFRLPLHARIPSALKKGFPVCGGLSRPQHRHPFTKKSFLTIAINNAFFVLLGCLL
jgi:hypothetical protein